ncbi:MAG TPA: hypothetical protein VGM56_15360 [Byssovorax sp.]|jgi:hypothetical protein
MGLNEANLARIERLTARLAARHGAATSDEARAAFEADFVRQRDAVLVPLLQDLGVALARAGHAFEIELDAGERRPGATFRVLLSGGARGNRNEILFYVQHADASEVIVHLALRNEFELVRYQSIAAMTHAALEQMLVDGLEHLLVCNG